MIDDTPLEPDDDRIDTLLGLVAVLGRLDPLLDAAVTAPPLADPLPADDGVVEAALGLIALREALSRGLAAAVAAAPPPEPAAPAPPPLRDLLR